MTNNKQIKNLDPPTICDNCIHDEVCGLEGHLEPAHVYCGWKIDTQTSIATKFNKIKAIIDNWAVDDDEHELLEQISDIVNDKEK